MADPKAARSAVSRVDWTARRRAGERAASTDAKSALRCLGEYWAGLKVDSSARRWVGMTDDARAERSAGQKAVKTVVCLAARWAVGRVAGLVDQTAVVTAVVTAVRRAVGKADRSVVSRVARKDASWADSTARR